MESIYFQQQLNFQEFQQIFQLDIYSNFDFNDQKIQKNSLFFQDDNYNESCNQLPTFQSISTFLQNSSRCRPNELKNKRISRKIKSKIIQKKHIKNQIQKKKNSQDEKDQYEKNIVGNIMQVIIKQMLSQKYYKQINYYCLLLGLQKQHFFNFFKPYNGLDKRFGTSNLFYIFRSQKCQKLISLVLGLFMTRYLKEDYISYIITKGKMKNSQLYIEKAIQLIHVPEITKEQYKKYISSFKNLA